MALGRDPSRHPGRDVWPGLHISADRELSPCKATHAPVSLHCGTGLTARSKLALHDPYCVTSRHYAGRGKQSIEPPLLRGMDELERQKDGLVQRDLQCSLYLLLTHLL